MEAPVNGDLNGTWRDWVMPIALAVLFLVLLALTGCQKGLSGTGIDDVRCPAAPDCVGPRFEVLVRDWGDGEGRDTLVIYVRYGDREGFMWRLEAHEGYTGGQPVHITQRDTGQVGHGDVLSYAITYDAGYPPVRFNLWLTSLDGTGRLDTAFTR
jgi:hypothetical protein